MTAKIRPNPWDKSALLSCVVAIPVRNERQRIGGCIEALANQVGVPGNGLGILIFLNNCSDGTRQVVEAWIARSPWPIRIIECESQSPSAGWARHRAMEAAAAWLDEAGAAEGLLLTTDADSVVPPTWVAANDAAIAAGADAVAGRVAFDPREMAPLSTALIERQSREIEYEHLLAEIEARLVPQPGNPWPCHWTKSGASIAVTLSAFRFVGGMPSIRSGEDHAFIDRLAAFGLVVRHAPDIVVVTSGRLDGRAQGGTAETLKAWSEDPDSLCDARLERLGSFVVRTLRRRMGLGNNETTRRGFKGRSLLPRDLPLQIRRARLLLRLVRSLGALRAGSSRFAPCRSREMPEQLSLP